MLVISHFEMSYGSLLSLRRCENSLKVGSMSSNPSGGGFDRLVLI